MYNLVIPDHKHRKHYTLKSLERNSKRYEDNFKMMMKSVGTKAQQRYVDIEDKLNRLDIIIRQALGMYISDPCPLYVKYLCDDCTGYYIRQVERHKTYCYMEKDSKGFRKAHKCIMKDVKMID
jgi:hypothetical protein